MITFTILSLINLKGVRVENPLAAYIFGFISGVFGGAYNISGPPVVLYGSLANWDSHHFRATIQSYALFTNILAIIGHLLTKNIIPAVTKTYLWALPVVALSIWLGTLIHNRIPSERYQIVVKNPIADFERPSVIFNHSIKRSHHFPQGTSEGRIAFWPQCSKITSIKSFGISLTFPTSGPNLKVKALTSLTNGR